MNRLELLLKALVELTKIWGDAKCNHSMIAMQISFIKQCIRDELKGKYKEEK